MKTMKEIGEKCRANRRAKEVKAQDVARALGRSSTAIWHFERGDTDSAIVLLWYIEHGYITLEECI